MALTAQVTIVAITLIAKTLLSHEKTWNELPDNVVGVINDEGFHRSRLNAVLITILQRPDLFLCIHQVLLYCEGEGVPIQGGDGQNVAGGTSLSGEKRLSETALRAFSKTMDLSQIC